MIKVSKTDLSLALRCCMRVMDNNPTMPILRYTKFQYQEGYLYIDAGNPSDHAFARIKAEGEDAIGCIDPRKLFYLLPSLGEEIIMTPHKGKLLIKRPTGNVLLATEDPTSFPPMPIAKEAGEWIVFPREGIKEMCTSLLCGTDEEVATMTRWQNVALIRCAGEEYLAVTTDGKRTALVDGKCSGVAGTELLVPIKALRALRALVDTLPADVTTIKIGQDKTRIWIYMGNSLRFVYSKINTEFPDIFGEFLSKVEFNRELAVSSEAVAGALQLIKVIGDDKVRSFRFEADDKSVLFATRSVNGEGSERVEAVSKNGFKPFITGYNADYLLPIFEQVEGTISIQFAEMASTPIAYPMKIVSEGADIRSSWITQSLNIYPKDEAKEAKK